MEVRLEHFLNTKVEKGDKKLRWALPREPVRKMVTQFVDFMELWPPGGDDDPVGVTRCLQRLGCDVAHQHQSFLSAGGCSVPLPLLAWIVAYGLRPKVLYVEVPRGYDPPAGTVQFLQDACQHQAAQGLVATVKIPAGSPLRQDRAWAAAFQGAPWHFHTETTACKQCARKETGSVWLSNWNFALRSPCRHPDGESWAGSLTAADSLRAQYARQVKQALPLFRRGT